MASPQYRSFLSLERVEDKVLLAICFIVVIASVAGAIFDLSAAWFVPLIFTALYGILRLLLPLRGSRELLDQARQELSELRAALSNHKCAKFRYYENNAEFYGTLSDTVLGSAKNRLDLWYVRQDPPTAFVQKETRRYFDDVLKWARANPSRSVRRLICVHSPQMRAWAIDHFKETSRVPNYEAHVVEWNIRADLLNMAIVDESTVFLALSGGTHQSIRGMSIEDSGAAHYFSDFFNQHWSASTPLPEWARRQRAAEAAGSR